MKIACSPSLSTNRYAFSNNPVIHRKIAQSAADVFISKTRPSVHFAGKNPVVSVPMGQTYGAIGLAHRKEILTTESLQDCSAIIYLGDYDAAKEKYRTRVLSHINGSDLHTQVTGQTAGALVLNLLQSAQDDPNSRICLVYGISNSDFQKPGILEQVYQGRQPILECQNLLGDRFSTLQGLDVQVTPRGQIKITR